MSHRTVPLSELHKWSAKWRDEPRRRAAVREMSEWITGETPGRESLLPGMLIRARSLSDTADGEIRAHYRHRIDRIFRALSTEYLARRGVARLTNPTSNRLYALAKLCVDKNISTIHPLPRLFLASENDLRVSLPHSFVATLNGEIVVLSLYYNEAFPWFDKYGLAVVGQIGLGGLAIGLEDRLACDDGNFYFELPAPVTDVITIDIARQRRDKDARIVALSEQRGRFLDAYKRAFMEELADVSAMYQASCKELEIDTDRFSRPAKRPRKPPEAGEAPSKTA